MFRPRWASFFAVLFALSGCTLLLGYGDEVQLAPDAGSADTPDVLSPDATVPDDRPFCERQTSRPTFCASFDKSSYLSEWNETVTKNARLDRDTSSFVSGPASLRISLDRKDDGNVEGALFAPFDAWAEKPFSITMGFDIEIEAAAPANSFAVLASPIVMAATDRASYLIQLTGRVLADGSTVALNLVEVTNGPDASSDHPSSVSLQIGRWAHVDLAMSLGGPSNAARLSVDGAVGYDGALELSGSGVPYASFGLATLSPDTTVWTYRFDNVLVTIR